MYFQKYGKLDKFATQISTFQKLYTTDMWVFSFLSDVEIGQPTALTQILPEPHR